jgi:DNA-binding winged helix-turn-helix (wHTH) protein
MQAEKEILFPPFRLDMVNECVWKETEAISLTPKAFAVLRYLVGHPGQLVSKEELLNAIWPEVYVSDAVLKVCVREIRKVLGDQPKAPRFIETLHRRGYRFIAPLTTAHQPVASSQHRVVRHPPQSGWLDEWGRLKGDHPSL